MYIFLSKTLTSYTTRLIFFIENKKIYLSVRLYTRPTFNQTRWRCRLVADKSSFNAVGDGCTRTVLSHIEIRHVSRVKRTEGRILCCSQCAHEIHHCYCDALVMTLSLLLFPAFTGKIAQRFLHHMQHAREQLFFFSVSG